MTGRAAPATVRLPRSYRYALAMAFVSMLLLTVVSVLYAQHAVDRGGRKFCTLVVGLDEANHESPPLTDRGRQLADDMTRLRRDLGC